jgi:hypothetical protein
MEIKGETSSIQSYFHTFTTSASVSVGWGPFPIANPSVSHKQGASQCFVLVAGESLLTSEDYTSRITTKGPQIIS